MSQYFQFSINWKIININENPETIPDSVLSTFEMQLVFEKPLSSTEKSLALYNQLQRWKALGLFLHRNLF